MIQTPRKARIFLAGHQPSAPVLKPYGAEREVFPYWKVQFFLPQCCAWKDIQAKFLDRGEALNEAAKVKAKKGRARLMEVRREGRTPLMEI